MEHYFQILNAGMASSQPNITFQALDQVYAPDATLAQSTPTGHVNVFHGLYGANGIESWYLGFQSLRPGLHFTQDLNHPRRNLALHVVLSYETALPAGFSAPGRCIHVFTLKGRMIQTLDWATFFGGTP